MTDLFAAYDTTRARMIELVQDANDDALSTMVPSCPEWTAKQLFTHCVSLPAEIGAGNLPTGDPNEWINSIVAVRSDRSIDELVDEWATTDDTLRAMLGGGGGLIFNDLMVHEHDLRAALGAPDHSALDASISIPASLEFTTPALIEKGLGSIEIRSGSDVWRSHDAEPGWVLEVSPWEATRALFSRRTADELRALGESDNIEAYIEVIGSHLPLPANPLNEP